MADLTPELLGQLKHYAELWNDNELAGCCDVHPDSPVGHVLRALPTLVTEARKLGKIRALLAADNDSPEGVIGSRFLVSHIREVLDGDGT